MKTWRVILRLTDDGKEDHDMRHLTAPEIYDILRAIPLPAGLTISDIYVNALRVPS